MSADPDVNLWLDPYKGWCLTVPAKMPDSALRVMIAYAVTLYEKRFKSMPSTSPDKRRLEHAIKRLQELKVTQIIQPA